MTLDVTHRLAALHSPDIKEAISLRLPKSETETKTGDDWVPEVIIENALARFLEDIEAALIIGNEELVLTLELAELIALALKTRKRPAHRPRHSRDQNARRAGLIAYALKLKAELRKSGVPAGEAELRAATIVAEVGGQHGDPASPSTIRKLMKHRGKKLY